MQIDFHSWPEHLADRYRRCGYWLDQPLTTLLDAQARQRPDAIALICGERQFSYAELAARSSNLAGRLAERGLGPGDTALVQLPNVAEFYLVFFALLKIGVAPVNALFSHRRLELESYVQQLQPSVLIASREHALFANDHFVEELQSLRARSLALFLHDSSAERGLESWLASPARSEPTYAPTGAREVAFFQLSGGSTGKPKLIPRTHDDYFYSVRASAELCGLSEATRFLCALPAAHNFPLSSPGALGVFHAGGTVVMAPNPEPTRCFALIHEHQVDLVALVPSALAHWLEAALGDRAALASLKLVQVGGASFPESLARRVPGALGCKLQQVFGMAEGLVNYTRLDDPEQLVFSTQGRPLSADDELKIVDEAGQQVGDGEVGQLATRGPYTFRGYYRSPEHNARVFDADGYYYTGDLVQRTPEGYLRVVGRVKDQINRGGEKISAEEVERLMLSHPDVSDAALVAMHDAQLGEKSCAFIVSRDPNLKPIALRRHLFELGVAEYKLPDRVCFLGAMPLTAVGKIDKEKLRSIASAR